MRAEILARRGFNLGAKFLTGDRSWANLEKRVKDDFLEFFMFQKRTKEVINVGNLSFSVDVKVFLFDNPSAQIRSIQKIYIAERIYHYEPGKILGVFTCIADALQVCLKDQMEAGGDDQHVTEYALGIQEDS
jgi:hypothetical protein